MIPAQEARERIGERRQFLDSGDTIAAGMSEFLKTSELTQTRVFIHSFVKEIEVRPSSASIVYSLPTPEDSSMGGANAAEIALNGAVMNSVCHDGLEWTLDGAVFEIWLGML